MTANMWADVGFSKKSIIYPVNIKDISSISANWPASRESGRYTPFGVGFSLKLS